MIDQRAGTIVGWYFTGVWDLKLWACVGYGVIAGVSDMELWPYGYEISGVDLPRFTPIRKWLIWELYDYGLINWRISSIMESGCWLLKSSIFH